MSNNTSRLNGGLLQLKVSPELAKELLAAADADGEPVSVIARHAVRLYLQDRKSKGLSSAAKN